MSVFRMSFLPFPFFVAPSLEPTPELVPPVDSSRHTHSQIDVSVNAPTSGKINELLANEEDTVMVGQGLFRIAPGEADEPSPQPANTPSPAPSGRAEVKETAPKPNQRTRSSPHPG